MRYWLVGICACLIGVSSASAETLVRTSSQYQLPTDQVIEGNFVGAGNPISISGEVTEDATLLGNRVTVTGTIGADLLTLGVLTRLDGLIQQDVRVVSGNTTISGTIAGDVLVLSGSVEILPEATIEGDLLLYAGSALVSGTVGGNIAGSLQSINIDGPVAGSVDVHTQQLSLGNNAAVAGSVSYTSSNLLTQSIDTVIEGEVVRSDPVVAANPMTLRSVVFPIVTFVFATLVWLFLSRGTLTQVVVRTATHVPRSAGVGTVTVLVTPLIVFILYLSVLGSFVATGMLVGYVLLVLLAVASLPALVGYFCFKASGMKGMSVSTLTVIMGSVVCGVLLLLPAIGLFVLLLLAVIALGGLVDSVIRFAR